MIRGVHHVSLSTRNFEGLLHFYRDLLGLPFATSYDWQRGSIIRLPINSPPWGVFATHASHGSGDLL